LDNRLKVGDWVIIDGEQMGVVETIIAPIFVDVRINGEGHLSLTDTTKRKLIKITKEVADIMRGV
jgi:hypothetical protein